MREEVILVDADDVEIGTQEKLRAHREGRLHRALSIFIFNRSGALMLQQRAPDKYHCGGLWSNTCCSHPRPGESVEAAARRRLREEMGFSCPLHPLFRFTYRATFDSGLIEHEVDHVLAGFYEGTPRLNAAEATAWRWITPAALEADLAARPEAYTYWFKLAWRRTLPFARAHAAPHAPVARPVPVPAHPNP